MELQNLIDKITLSPSKKHIAYRKKKKLNAKVIKLSYLCYPYCTSNSIIKQLIL